jgi:AcrR family transcriptional regulator
MATIAQQAGVNVDTIYTLVGRKPALFRELVETAISGEDRAVPAEERDYVRAIREQVTPEGKLAVYAEALPTVHERLAPLIEVLKEAGSTEPELARIWTEIEERRSENMLRLAQQLAESGRLKVDPRVAADIIWTTNSPEVYLLLVKRRGWSHRRYAGWLRDTWISQLLEFEG